MKTNYHHRKKGRIFQKSKFIVLIKRTLFITILIALTVILVIFVSIIFIIRKNISLGKSINTAVVYKDVVSIIKFDPISEELFILNIPGSLVVGSAGGYGNYQLKNIYSLSENEKTGNELFRKTIMKNLHIPIHGVIDCRKIHFKDNSTTRIILYCNTNRNFGEIINAIFSKWRSGGNVTVKNLMDYNVVTEDPDTAGIYKLKENIFATLEFDFSQDIDIEQVVNLEIGVDGGSDVPDYINDVIKLMGGRVVGETSENNKRKVEKCKITGGKISFIKNIGRVFDCSTEFAEGQNDAKLEFSDEYLKTF